MIQIQAPIDNVINKIYHFADLHIRAGINNGDKKTSRYDEYINVLNAAYNFIVKINKKSDFVVLIAGDIIHDNKKIGSTCIDLFYEIILKFASICPVYIIRGNHDYNQSSVHDQDMITSLMKAVVTNKNIVYLNSSGLYQSANVIFGLIAIQDVLKKGDSFGRIESLPEFPDPGNGTDMKKVALFHGDIINTFDINYFGKNYDYVLLGDLHRLQVYNATQQNINNDVIKHIGHNIYEINTYARMKQGTSMISYSGSTIQQNFGESLIGHGFIEWDIQNDIAKAFHVKNEYGFITVKNDNDIWYVNLNFPSNEKNIDNWVNINDAILLDWFPKRVNIRIKKKSSELSFPSELLEILQKSGIIIENAKFTVEDSFDETNTISEKTKCMDLREFNEPKSWCQFISDNVVHDNLQFKDWKDFIMNPTSIRLNDIPSSIPLYIKNDISERNKKIEIAIEDYTRIKENNVSIINSHIDFTMLYMEWEYILCYGAKSYFNFENLKKDIHLVGGLNGHGKTSFLEVICFALFGEGFPSRSNKTYSSSIICLKKPEGIRANTLLCFRIDSKIFRITRTFDVCHVKKVNSKDILLQEYDGDKFNIVHSGKKNVTEWIKSNIGTVGSFLTSCIVTQTCDEDFFSKKNNDQKIYIDTQLGLEVSTYFYNIIKTASLGYDDICKKLFSVLEIRKEEFNKSFNNISAEGLQDYENKVLVIKNELKRLEDEYDTNKSVWFVVNESVLSQGKDKLITYIEDLEAKIADLHIENPSRLEYESELLGKIKHDFKVVEEFNNKPLIVIDKPVFEKSSSHKNDVLEQLDSLNKKILEIKYTKSDLDNIEDNIDNLEGLYERHCLDLDYLKRSIKDTNIMLNTLEVGARALIRPDKFIVQENDYIEWKNLIKKFDNKKEPCIPRPIWTECTVNTENDKFIKWFNELKKGCNHNKDTVVDELENMIGVCKVEYDNINMKLQKLIPLRETALNDISRLENIINQDLTKQIIVLENKPNVKYNKVTCTEYVALQKKVKSYEYIDDSGIEKLRNIIIDNPIIKDNLIKVKEHIKEYKSLIDSCEKHSFNPKCKSCMAHPWKLKLDSLTKKHDIMMEEELSLSSRLVDDNVYEDAKNKINLIEDYQANVEKCRDYDLLYEWDKQKKGIESVINSNKKKVLKIKDTLQKDEIKIKCLNDDILKSHIHLEKLLNYNKEWTNEYRKLKEDIQFNQQSIIEWREWDIINEHLSKKTYHEEQAKLREDMKKYEEDMKKYEEDIRSLRNTTEEDINKCTEIESNKELIQNKIYENKILLDHANKDCLLYTEINNDIINNEIKLKHINKWIEYDIYLEEEQNIKKAIRLYNLLKDKEEYIRRLKEFYILNETVNDYKKGVDVIDSYEISKTLELQIENKNKQVCELELHINQYRERLELKQKNQNEIVLIENYYRDIVCKAQTLQAITSKFVNFKDYILQEHIMPIICQNVNVLLKIMCKNHRPVELQCVFDDKGNFNWLLQDFEYAPPIEKSSGFQRFVISLSMRIVLGRFGISGIKNSQLFLDECFTACDHNNLENIPYVLTELLSMYESVVIVSHLCDLKANIGSIIDITRSLNGLSNIKYGIIDPKFSLSKRCVGRPKLDVFK